MKALTLGAITQKLGGRNSIENDLVSDAVQMPGSVPSAVLDFSGCNSLLESSFLADGLAGLAHFKLRGLQLSLARSSALMNLDVLGDGLCHLTNLTCLVLDCKECGNLISIAKFGEILPQLTQLTHISLTLNDCSNLVAVDELASLGTLAKIAILKIELQTCESLQSVDCVLDGLSQLPGVDEFVLNLSGCSRLPESYRHRFECFATLLRATGRQCLQRGLHVLQSLLDKGIATELTLDLCMCDDVEDTDEFGLSLGKLAELRFLKLSFASCKLLQSVQGLAEGLSSLNSLEHMVLDFTGCDMLPKPLQTCFKSYETFLAVARPLLTEQGLSLHLQVLAGDKGRKKLALDLSSVLHVEDTRLLGTGLAKLVNLSNFDLELRRCSRLVSIDGIVEGLSQLQQLQSLKLSLCECPKLSNVTAFAEGFVGLPQLVSLELDLSSCSISSADGLRGIRHLQRLESLTLRMKSCKSITSVPELAAIGYLSNLTSLTLELAGCSAIESIEPFGNALAHEGASSSSLPLLAELRLDLRDCSSLRSIERLAGGLAKVSRLKSLRLDLGHCVGLSNVDQLGNSIMGLENLRSLQLYLMECHGLTSVDELVDGIAQHSSFQTFYIALDSCRQLPQKVWGPFFSRESLWKANFFDQDVGKIVAPKDSLHTSTSCAKC